ncbi:MAG: RidA family protein [Alphaproteobacteria bacterium]|jgi:enamine deaminase RidA (YjgF/YER057c/UK114 family)
MTEIAKKLKELGIVLPEVSLPAANYVPVVVAGGMAFVSGQLPMQGGKPQFIGKVGREFTLEQGQDCARLCGINILAHVFKALGGDWGRIDRLIRLGVFVNAPDDFTDHPKVANGVSDMMVAIFGDAGRHARFAVGVAGLPFGVAVEVDATFALKS